MASKLTALGAIIATFGAEPAVASTTRLSCAYQATHSPKISGPQDAKGFKLEFTLDNATGKAYMVGNAGLSDVFVTKGSEGLTFLETLPTGAVQSTTVSWNGESVHSRHSMIQGALVPSQYYGRCK